MRRFGELVTCVLLLTTGCEFRDVTPVDPRVSRFFETTVGQDGVADVDVLFVIDDSQSMREEQDSLRREIPLLVEGLVDPPLGDDGEPTHNAVESLNVAIVTTNMGTSGVYFDAAGARCAANESRGDDGALRADPDTGGQVFRWRSGDDPDAFGDAIARTADVGTTGCGLEQPLAAAVAALRHDGFPRDGSLLAVVVLSDEEDCSLADPAGYFATDERGSALNRRCVEEQHLLLPVDQVIADIRGARGDESFLFAALVGVPEDIAERDVGAILADPRMQYVPNLTNDLGLEPACNNERGMAAPGRRYLQLAARLDGALVRSICARSFAPAIDELTRRIGARIGDVCVERALTPDVDGAVACEVREILPAGRACDALPARSYLETTPEGREVCVVAQATGGVASGWRYEADDGGCEQVRFTEDAIPPFGARIQLECLVDVEVSTDPGTVSP